jgi:hypothetical protein
MAIISGYYIGANMYARAARAQDISANIDPIDLKYGGMII